MDFVEEILPYTYYAMGFQAAEYILKTAYVVDMHLRIKKNIGASGLDQFTKETRSAYTRTIARFVMFPFPLDLRYLAKLRKDKFRLDRS